ncbi:protein phosphatase 2C-like protein [Haloactinopolyspora alba]|uniref:Protein phosphatase 2C-like protein n=1 Tax=Haloactinopolyspora alba TaxID=648780 RepID=A0A2P8EB95_9ACTN|nr:protein phosphatase 2C domain-containing protein [Haloactinopolyspora alba]PSL06744.1 protein phosphatase 2C-like protein [Haloactinopolyspora alba]
MQVTFSSQPAPGGVNEDLVVAGPSWVVVLDGATAPPGVDSGCRHKVRWLVERLAARLCRPLTLGTQAPLPDVLATAIAGVRDEHGSGCDLDNPDSPSSTVALARVRDDMLDYLVLADSAVLLDVAGTVSCVTDARLDHLPEYSVDAVAARRNRPDGFWVASTSAEAAYQARTGSVPLNDVRRFALVSDGVARYVELLGLGDWPQLLDALADDGPDAVVGQVRAAEATHLGRDPRGPHGRRVKRHDDATAAYVAVQARNRS